MSERMRFFRSVLVVATVTLAALAVLIFLAGCEEEPQVQQAQSTQQMHAEHDHASHAQTAAEQPEAETTTVAVEQKTCPIMEGNPINPNLFVEYKGKKVYFCCAGCPEKFLANPEQYVAKLPQFQD